MSIRAKIIFILILIVIIYHVGFNNKELFTSLNLNSNTKLKPKNQNQNQNQTQTQTQTKMNYNSLEMKILTSNPDYNNLTFYLKKYNTNFLYNLENLNVSRPLIITYDNKSVQNDSNESFVNFLKGLVYYKYNYIVCGINTKWDGWYGRYKIYLDLLNTIPSSQLIFITDSRDVLVNNSPDEFVSNYDKLITKYKDLNKNKIIFGTEIGCCVNQMWHYSPGSVFSNIDDSNVTNARDSINKQVFEKNLKSESIFDKIKFGDILDKIEESESESEYNKNHSYSLKRNDKIFPNGKDFPWEHWIKWNNFFKEKFIEANIKYKLDIKDKKYPIIKLNFGMMAGLSANILKMLKLFDMQPGEDDQHLASEFFYSRPEMIILDYTQLLLSNTGYKHSFRKCTSNTMNNTYYNVNFNDHLNDHNEYIDMDVYTREDIPEQGIMYGFDVEKLKYFFTFDDIISFPCFIQSPGKDWNCYNELLFRLPYCDDKMCSYYYNLEQTQKYNVRDIIIHEYKNQKGGMEIEWILGNLLNPLYWALDLFIMRDLYSIVQTNLTDSNTFLLLDSGNLLGWYRFSNLSNNSGQIMPWDDDIDLGWFSNEKFNISLLDKFFKLIIKKGYDIFIYYKEKNTKYSSAESDHYTIRIDSSNILQIPYLLSRYELVLFNVSLNLTKYEEILRIFNMNADYEEKYPSGNIKIPSVDIFMYEFDDNNKTFNYKKIFGVGYSIEINSNFINPIKNIKYNGINVMIPNNVKKSLDLIYNTNFIQDYNNFDIIKIKRHDSFTFNSNINTLQKSIDEFNNMRLSVENKNILLITKIYNNFINKYFDIIDKNDTIKKIIYTTK